MKKLFSVAILILVILLGYTFHIKEGVIIDTGNHKDSHTIAQEHIKDKGYNIISYEGNSNYVLTKKKLTEVTYREVWIMQKEGPDKYLGKTVYQEEFIVKNHPLDYWAPYTKKNDPEARALGKVRVYVIVVDNKAIGGISLPVTKDILCGARFSLEGKKFEEVHSIGYNKFRDQWYSKYGKKKD